MSGVDHNREPCPDRIIDDVGGAFGMGAVGGGIWHMIKGARNSPRGHRFIGGIDAVRREAPRLGGSFAVWGGLFAVVDCSLVYVRKKEDPWNAIAAGAATGGILQLRSGLVSAGKSALVGGALLALIEGVGIMITRISVHAPPPPLDLSGMGGGAPAPAPGAPAGSMVSPSPAPPPLSSSGPEATGSGGAGGGGWFGGWFGGAGSGGETASPGPKETVLDSAEGGNSFGQPKIPERFK